MSTLKIVGLESEIWMDRVGATSGEDYNDRIEINYLSKMVECALILSGAALAVDRDFYFGLRKIIEEQLSQQRDKGTVEQIITAHVQRTLGLEPEIDHKEEGVEENISGLREREQVFGFSGGYTPSGHRIYVDGSFPEVCTPECSSPYDLVQWERAGELLLRNGVLRFEEETGRGIVLYKNNADGQGKSWGSHENYLVAKKLFSALTEDRSFKRLNPFQLYWVTFLVTRMIYTGAGKVGYDKSFIDPGFILSQRAEFMQMVVYFDTMLMRPWINTRDISYVGSEYGHRLHVIAGDANMCDRSLFLRIGMSMIVLMMLEDLADSSYPLGSWPVLKDIFMATKVVNEDVECSQTLPVSVRGVNKEMSALDIQFFLSDLARDWYERKCKNDHPPEKIFWIPKVLDSVDEVMSWIKRGDLAALFGKIDWVTKFVVCGKALERAGKHKQCLFTGSLDVDQVAYLKPFDLIYHRLDSKGLCDRLRSRGDIEMMFDEQQIKEAATLPPKDTRAYNRGTLIGLEQDSIAGCNWQYVIYRNGKKVVLNSPWRS